MPSTATTRPRPNSTRCCSASGRRCPSRVPMRVPRSTLPTLMNVPVMRQWQDGAAMDILLVSLGSTAGLRRADDALVGALERAGASVAVARAAAPGERRTFALTDLAWARAARRAAQEALEGTQPRAILYSSMGAALLWPRGGGDPLRRADDRQPARPPRRLAAAGRAQAPGRRLAARPLG